MPPAGSIGEAVAKGWMIRERFLKGFSMWQLVLAVAMGRTDPYLLAADSIGELISNVHLLKPLSLPPAWQRRFDGLLDEARFELEKEEARQAAKEDPNTTAMIAERKLDPEEALRVIDQWSKLQDEQ